MRFTLAVLSVGALTIALPACSSSTPEDPGEELAAARSRTVDLYSRSVDDTLSRYFACLDEVEATGSCVLRDPLSPTSVRVVVTGVRTADFGEKLARARQVGQMVRQLLQDAKGKLCETVAPLARLEHPYFFYGVSGAAGVGAAGTGSVDVYFDLANQQAAVFTSAGVSAGTTSGVEGSAYLGYAFGDMPNVLAAGSGRVCAASGGLGIKALAGVSLTGSVFSSPDGSFVGASAGVSAAIGLWEVPVDVGVSVTDSGAWDGATRALAANGWGFRRDVITDGATGHDYVQYGSAVDMAIAILWNVPPPQSVAVATQVLGLAALRETGLTIEQACPDEVAAVPPPSLGKLGELCDALPNFHGDGEQAGGGEGSADGGVPGALDPTDCGDKTDGWWCFGFSSGFMVYCQGKQISGGCGCASCATGGVPAGCGGAPPPAACPD